MIGKAIYFTYMVVLLLVLVMGVMLAVLTVKYFQREWEKEDRINGEHESSTRRWCIYA